MSRAQYVESLKVERAAIASRPPDHPQRARRLADIDAELDRYAEEPTERRQEAAVPPAAPAPAPESTEAPVVVEAPAAPEPVKAPVAKKAAAKKAPTKRAPAKKK